MRTLVLFLLLPLLTLPALAQRFPRIANTLADMRASNPYVVHTNVFVADTNRGGMFFWLPGSTITTNLGTVYASTYAGVTGRYVRDIDGPLNVLWFGADKTGVADSTVALQAAADLALVDSNYGNRMGAVISLPGGIYRVTSPITLKPGTRLLGDALIDTQIRNVSTTNDTLRFYGTPINGISSPISVEHLFLFGNDAATAGAGIKFSGITNNIEVVLRDVLVYGHFNGIVLDNTIGGEVSKTRVVNAVNNAYKLGPAMTTMSFSGNVAQGGAAGDGWHIQDTVYCSFIGNASDYKKTGWYLTNVANCNFSGNGAENNTEDGMQLVATRYLVIDGLYSQARNAAGGSRSALRIDGGDSITLAGFWAAVPGGTQTGAPLDLTNTLTAAFPTRVTMLGAIDFPAWGTGSPNRPDLLTRVNAEDQTFTSTQSKFTRGYTSGILQQDNNGGYLQFTNTLGLLVGGHTNLLALLELNATNGVPKDIRFSTFNTNRWLLRSSATAETGSDVGSDFQIIRLDDAGAVSSSVLYANRASGFVALGNVTNPGYQLDVAGDGNIRGTIFGVRGVPYVWPAANALGELHNNGAGILSWVPTSGGSGGTNTPGGSNTQLQFNDASTFGGASAATYDSSALKTTLDRLNVPYSLERGVTNATGASITFDLRGEPVLFITNNVNQTITLTAPQTGEYGLWLVFFTASGTNTMSFVAPGGYTLQQRVGSFPATQPAGLNSYVFEKIGGTIIYYDSALHTHAWTDITSTPTTIAGYGITNGVSDSRQILTIDSLTGGGDLSANRTLALVNDTAVPGNSKYYGTSGAGTRGYHDLPSTSSFDFASYVISTNEVTTPVYTNSLGTNTTVYLYAKATGAGATNSAAFEIVAEYRRDAGTAVLISTNNLSIMPPATAMSARWRLDNNDAILEVLGQTNTTCNWRARGWVSTITNGVALSAINIADQLISHWTLDEAAGVTRVDTEPTGTPQDLADNGTVTQDTGVISNAAEFLSTSSQYLSRADSADLSTGDIDFTFSGWIWFDSTTGTRTLVAQWGAAANRSYRLIYTSSRFRFDVSNDGTATVSVTADAFGAASISTWYHVVAWHDAATDTLGIRINDSAENTASHATGVFDGTSTFSLGRESGSGNYLSGRLDQWRFHKRLLNTAEKTYLYNGGAGN